MYSIYIVHSNSNTHPLPHAHIHTHYFTLNLYHSFFGDSGKHQTGVRLKLYAHIHSRVLGHLAAIKTAKLQIHFDCVREWFSPAKYKM